MYCFKVYKLCKICYNYYSYGLTVQAKSKFISRPELGQNQKEVQPMYINADGAYAPTLEHSRYNPFKEGVNTSNPIYSTFVKWNGRKDQEHKYLKSGKVYKVVSAEIASSYTDLILQEIDTGTILPEKYNSVLFEALPTYVGYSDKLPKLGESYHLVILNLAERKMVGRTTTSVRGIEHLGTNTWIVITGNSVYVSQIM